MDDTKITLTDIDFNEGKPPSAVVRFTVQSEFDPISLSCHVDNATDLHDAVNAALQKIRRFADQLKAAVAKDYFDAH
jgi:hypothetical protein